MNGRKPIGVSRRELGDRLAVSRREAADRLSVSVDTLAREIAKGNLRAVRFGRRLLIPVRELARLMEE